MSRYELYLAPVVKEKTNVMTRSETVQYVRDHSDVRPRRLLAEATGHKINYIYDVLREIGLGSPDGFDHRKPELDAKIAEVYPDHSNKWIAKHLHCGEGTIDRCRKRLGLKKSPEYLKAISRRRSEYGKRKRSEEEIQKVQRSLAKTRRREEWRVMSGMKQKTKLKVKMYPARITRTIWYLTKRRGYIKTTNTLILQYDESTRRVPDENYYYRKYNIKFEKTDMDMEQEKCVYCNDSRGSRKVNRKSYKQSNGEMSWRVKNNFENE